MEKEFFVIERQGLDEPLTCKIICMTEVDAAQKYLEKVDDGMTHAVEFGDELPLDSLPMFKSVVKKREKLPNYMAFAVFETGGDRYWWCVDSDAFPDSIIESIKWNSIPDEDGCFELEGLAGNTVEDILDSLF